MPPVIPDPDTVRPLGRHTPRVVYLKPLVADERIQVGDYTYYDDPDAADEFETRNVLYNYGNERLIIGKYCQIATGTRFLMGGAAHPAMGVSTYPFTMFGGAWAESTMDIVMNMPSKGDTVVGNDVWFGYGSIIMPGVSIGDGAIIATGAVVTSDVEPYMIVGGNPAQPIKRRFDEAEARRMLTAAWWDWPVELVTQHVRTIMSGSPEELEEIAAGVTGNYDDEDY